ncbi:hypothetical protein WME89_09740 [Sorangium sp. So ce321]|uniref:hypothetical protein n=1 Tax=Sorangium sp. So ce321 TaxID=3133300 RepID=UPI003F615784
MYDTGFDAAEKDFRARRWDEEPMPAGVPPRTSTLAKAAAGALAGAAAGAAVGAIAGPPGAVAGTVIGTLVGTVAEVVVARDRQREALRDAALDEEIGVVGGHIGDALPGQPPVQRGTLSAPAAGTAEIAGTGLAGGPLQSIEQA